jgi:hypothetical protein
MCCFLRRICRFFRRCIGYESGYVFWNTRIRWKQHTLPLNNVVCVTFFTLSSFQNPHKHQILRQCVVLPVASAGVSDDVLLNNAYTFFETHALVKNNTSVPEITSYAFTFWRHCYIKTHVNIKFYVNALFCLAHMTVFQTMDWLQIRIRFLKHTHT